MRDLTYAWPKHRWQHYTASTHSKQYRQYNHPPGGSTVSRGLTAGGSNKGRWGEAAAATAGTPAAGLLPLLLLLLPPRPQLPSSSLSRPTSTSPSHDSLRPCRGPGPMPDSRVCAVSETVSLVGNTQTGKWYLRSCGLRRWELEIAGFWSQLLESCMMYGRQVAR